MKKANHQIQNILKDLKVEQNHRKKGKKKKLKNEEKTKNKPKFGKKKKKKKHRKICKIQKVIKKTIVKNQKKQGFKSQLLNHKPNF